MVIDHGMLLVLRTYRYAHGRRTRVYIFQHGDSDVFAYSIDKTGVNIPPLDKGGSWLLRATVDDLSGLSRADYDEVVAALDLCGFYYFDADGGRAALSVHALVLLILFGGGEGGAYFLRCPPSGEVITSSHNSPRQSEHREKNER